MIAAQALQLALDHERGDHTGTALFCPACQTIDFAAKESALREQLAKKLEDRARRTDSSYAQQILNDLAKEMRRDT